jgi:hypothetical protein
MARKPALNPSGPQSERFKEAARELGCDESEERFDEALRKIGKAKPKPEPLDADAAPKKR